MLSVVMLNVTYNPFMLREVMLSVIIMNVIMLSVVAPQRGGQNWFHSLDIIKNYLETWRTKFFDKF